MRGSGEGHGGDADKETKKMSGLFRTKSMPKKRTHAFHFPLQAVSPVKRDHAESDRAQPRTSDVWEDEPPPVDYGVESPTLPPAVVFAPMGRASVNSNGTEGRGSKRLTM